MGKPSPKEPEVSLLKSLTAPSPQQPPQWHPPSTMTQATPPCHRRSSPTTSSTASSPTAHRRRASPGGNRSPLLACPGSTCRRHGKPFCPCSSSPASSFSKPHFQGRFLPRRLRLPASPCNRIRHRRQLQRRPHQRQTDSSHRPLTPTIASNRDRAPKVCRRWQGCRFSHNSRKTSQPSSRPSIFPRRR